MSSTDPRRQFRESDEAYTERMLRLAQLNKVRTEVDTIELRHIDWSPVPLYGYDHCDQMSQLAVQIGMTLGLKEAELKIVKTAGLMHDIGRSAPWQQADEGHQQRSAELAERTLRQSASWAMTDFIGEVCKLIKENTLSSKTPPKNPLAQCLWDADALESARFAPGTTEGLKIWKERTDNTLLCTPFARDREVKQRWLRHRGWR